MDDDENVTLTTFKRNPECVNNLPDHHCETGAYGTNYSLCTEDNTSNSSPPSSHGSKLRDDESKAVDCKKTTISLTLSVARRAKILCLLAVIMIVWGLLLLPVVIFFIPRDVEGINMLTARNDTSRDNGQMKVCEPYKGMVCREELLSLTTCYLGNADENDHPVVKTVSNLEEAEQSLSYVNLIESVNPQCSAEVKPFLCLYFFGLCNAVTGVSYQSSISQCKNLRDNVCMEEWNTAISLGFNLPDCDMEFSEDNIPCIEDVHETGESGSGLLMPATTEQTNCSDFSCREGFYCDLETGTNACLPQCGSWSQYSHSLNAALDSLILMSTCCGEIGGIAVLIVAGLRRKKAFVFPSILVVYQSITLLVLGAFVLITYMDNTTLYCTSDNLYQSLSQSTPFCVIAGVVLYYSVFQFATFWLCHILTLFWGLKFPLRARSFQQAGRMKYIHILCVVVGLLAPLIPVVATISQFSYGKSSSEAVRGGLGFGIIRFPPILCVGREKYTTFYSLILPVSIMLMVGITFVVFIFWIIHKQHGLFQARQTTKSHKIRIGIAERKILLVFMYFVFLAVPTLLSFSQATRDDELFAKTLLIYFDCERNGYDPDNPCDTSSYRKFIALIVFVPLSFILIGLYPLLNLVFVVDVQELKQVLKKHFPDTQEPSTNQGSLFSNSN